MQRVSYTNLARQDRLELWLYVAVENILAADNLLDEIDEKLLLLAGSPSLGRARPEIGSGIRQFPVRNYLIFYTPEPNGISVLRVLHGARRIEDLL
jgi:toxin ParE1/3/4